MKSQKGEPAFQDIDSILAEKVIEHTERNIDTGESSVNCSEQKSQHTERFRAICVLFFIFLFAIAAVKIVMFARSRR